MAKQLLDTKTNIKKTYRTRGTMDKSLIKGAKAKAEQTPTNQNQGDKNKSQKKRIPKNRLQERKFFKAKEDALILTEWREKKNKTSSRAICDQLAKEIDHSSESIRDRIKRYLSRLSQFDEGFLIDQAKVRGQEAMIFLYFL